MAEAKTAAAGGHLNLPNLLTYGRVAAVPVVVALLFWPDEMWARMTALGIYILAAITDFFDGYLARRLNMTSAFGAFLDPVALVLSYYWANILMHGPLNSRNQVMPFLISAPVLVAIKCFCLRQFGVYRRSWWRGSATAASRWRSPPGDRPPSCGSGPATPGTTRPSRSK